MLLHGQKILQASVYWEVSILRAYYLTLPTGRKQALSQAPTPHTFLPTLAPEALTSLPSVSKKSNCREIRYWVGATNCQMQFLLGGYSLGQPGLVMEPLSLVRNPPQAAGGTKGGGIIHQESSTLGRGPRLGSSQGEMGILWAHNSEAWNRWWGLLKVSLIFKSRMVCIHGHLYYLFWKMSQESAVKRDTEGPGKWV